MPKIVHFIHSVLVYANKGMTPNIMTFLPWFLAAYFVAPLFIEPRYAFVY